MGTITILPLAQPLHCHRHLRPSITMIAAAFLTPPPTVASIIASGLSGWARDLKPGLFPGSRETRVGRDLKPDSNPCFLCTDLVEARIRRAQAREKKDEPMAPKLGFTQIDDSQPRGWVCEPRAISPMGLVTHSWLERHGSVYLLDFEKL
ncbi:hypothetical protein CRG98_009550 [Punica granatum]|uniref:Uncharacterized protein n=1 Tax=Punica granatum TaxID=22663 RepID=A0A2I0KNL7_PUNGR|nr:hypothetical protein CRG98_009550 [Punica granatum]